MFKPYTIKQWNKEPVELDPSVLARIPIRNNFDDRYFNDKYQALPKEGYTKFISNILAHPNITVQLDTDFFKFILDGNLYSSKEGAIWKEIIYTGPIDLFFLDTNITNLLGSQNENLEPLEYRSINFVIENISNTNYYQPVSVVNYPEPHVAFTRIVEYKHFLNQSSPHTTIVREFTTDEGEPYYPVPNAVNLARYEKYKKIAENIKKNHGIHFIGRLANYKYFNMDEAINALVYYDENMAYHERSM
jgi:UDP-galactopyranose mutase